MSKETSDGARALGQFLSEHGLSITAFCERGSAKARPDGTPLKLGREHVTRVLRGDRGQRVTVDFARDISIATDGEVGMHLWASDTLRATCENDSIKAAS